ncbi:MAG: CPBP family intramembrane glutamic endopeptidase [Desulfococcaceae bacterium]
MATAPNVALRPAVQATFLVSLLEILFGFFVPSFADHPRWVMLGALGGLRLLQAVAVIGLFRWGEGELRDIGLKREDLLPGLRRGIIWSLGFGLLVLASFLVLWLAGMNPLGLFRAGIGATVPDRAALFLVGGLLGPVAEELIFRGVLYGFFRRWGILAALGISTAVFVLLHGGGGFAQMVGGVLFALAYEREKMLMTPITVHVLGNLALFSLGLIG